MHQNSEEFKQLGTMHMDNRASDYFPLEKPQPASVAVSPLASIKMDRVVAGAQAQTMRNKDVHARTMSHEMMKQAAADPEKARSAHIKMLVADRLKEEEIRNRLVTDEIVKMKRSGPRASSAQRRRNEALFPSTTNQETHCDE